MLSEKIRKKCMQLRRDPLLIVMYLEIVICS